LSPLLAGVARFSGPGVDDGGWLMARESFAKPCLTGNVVIPAKACIQCYQALWGFRVKPGMTGGGIIQRSSSFLAACYT